MAEKGFSRKPGCSILHRISTLRHDTLDSTRFATKARPQDGAGLDGYALRCAPPRVRALQCEPFSGKTEAHGASSVILGDRGEVSIYDSASPTPEVSLPSMTLNLSDGGCVLAERT